MMHDRDGWSALIWASWGEHEEVVEFLLEARADPGIPCMPTYRRMHEHIQAHDRDTSRIHRNMLYTLYE